MLKHTVSTFLKYRNSKNIRTYAHRYNYSYKMFCFCYRGLQIKLTNALLKKHNIDNEKDNYIFVATADNYN